MSERPAPTSPASPTTSPARTEKEMSRKRRGLASPSTRRSSAPGGTLASTANAPEALRTALPTAAWSAGAPRIPGFIAKYSSSRRPIMSCTSAASSSSVAACEATTRPSRSTVTVSHSRKISGMRWET